MTYFKSLKIKFNLVDFSFIGLLLLFFCIHSSASENGINPKCNNVLSSEVKNINDLPFNVSANIKVLTKISSLSRNMMMLSNSELLVALSSEKHSHKNKSNLALVNTNTGNAKYLSMGSIKNEFVSLVLFDGLKEMIDGSIIIGGTKNHKIFALQDDFKDQESPLEIFLEKRKSNSGTLIDLALGKYIVAVQENELIIFEGETFSPLASVQFEMNIKPSSLSVYNDLKLQDSSIAIGYNTNLGGMVRVFSLQTILQKDQPDVVDLRRPKATAWNQVFEYNLTHELEASQDHRERDDVGRKSVLHFKTFYINNFKNIESINNSNIFDHEIKVGNIVFEKNGHHLYISKSSGEVEELSLDDESKKTLSTLDNFTPILAISPDGNYLAMSTPSQENNLIVFNLKTKRSTKIFFNHIINSLVFSNDGNKVFAQATISGANEESNEESNEETNLIYSIPNFWSFNPMSNK